MNKTVARVVKERMEEEDGDDVTSSNQGDWTPEEDFFLEDLRSDFTLFPPIDGLYRVQRCETDDGRDPPSSSQFEDSPHNEPNQPTRRRSGILLRETLRRWRGAVDNAKRHDNLWLMVLFNRWRMIADESSIARRKKEFKALLHWASALQRKAFSSLHKHAQAQRDNERRACCENAPWSNRRSGLESREGCYVSPFSGAMSYRGKTLLLGSSLNRSREGIGSRAIGFNLRPPSYRRSTECFGEKCHSFRGSHLAWGSIRFGGRDRMDEVGHSSYASAGAAKSPSWPTQRLPSPSAQYNSDARRMRPVAVQSIASVKEYHATMYTVASAIDDMVCSIENA